MYVLVSNGSVSRYSLTQLRADNRNTSFPVEPSAELLATYGVYEATETPRPAYDYTKNVSETFQEIGGQWTQVWQELLATSDEMAQRLAAQWEDVRAERNRRLASCDWTQLADASVNAAAWTIYRQALRDLPQTQADPFNIVWPTSP
jgi:hypothetical protein